MHITDWLEMLGEHFPLVVIGCAEALLAVVLLCAALRRTPQASCADKTRSSEHAGGQKGTFPSAKKYRAIGTDAQPVSDDRPSDRENGDAGLAADTGS